MSSSDKIIHNFLTELNSDEVQEMFDALGNMLEHLENKEDPDPRELRIVDQAYQTLEKLRTLESMLKHIVGKSDRLTGNKLQDLYEKAPTFVGSQSFFD